MNQCLATDSNSLLTNTNSLLFCKIIYREIIYLITNKKKHNSLTHIKCNKSDLVSQFYLALDGEIRINKNIAIFSQSNSSWQSKLGYPF